MPFPIKKNPGVFGKVADSRSGEGNVQDECEI